MPLALQVVAVGVLQRLLRLRLLPQLQRLLILALALALTLRSGRDGAGGRGRGVRGRACSGPKFAPVLIEEQGKLEFRHVTTGGQW